MLIGRQANTEKKERLISRLSIVGYNFSELADPWLSRLKPRVVKHVRCRPPLPRDPSSSVLMKLTSLIKNLPLWHPDIAVGYSSLSLDKVAVSLRKLNKRNRLFISIRHCSVGKSSPSIFKLRLDKSHHLWKAPRQNILSAEIDFPRKEKEERLEKHSGSNSKSHRSAVKGQPSWQQRYGGTMVNHTHTSPQQRKAEEVTQKNQFTVVHHNVV